MELSDLVTKYNADKKDKNESYFEIFDILRKIEFEIPESLRLLAEIDAFDFYITTTFDNLMVKALNEVRFNGENKTKNLFFKNETKIQDITGEKEDPNNPIVYQIFGKAEGMATYVVTEEDLLEFGHLWQNEDRRPKKLSSFLKEKYILLLGCNFENWLYRFFLYAFKSDALFGCGQRGLIADNNSKNDEELTLFLSRCQTQLYNDNSISFVNELHKRWKDYSLTIQTKKVQKDIQSESDTFIKDSVFVSYADEDRSFVEKLKESLEISGIEIWFDKDKLEGGELFESVIKRNIENCSLFIPVISTHTLTDKSRFFWKEWNYAIDNLHSRPKDLPFIIPIIIDETSEQDKFIPEEFRNKFHLEHISEDTINEKLTEHIKNRLREKRRTI